MRRRALALAILLCSLLTLTSERMRLVEPVVAQAAPTETVTIDFENFALGKVLTTEIPGVRFPNGAVVVQNPPTGYSIPTQGPDGPPLPGTASQGICAKSETSNEADCRRTLLIDFPEGLSSLRFDAVGGYTDDWCDRQGSVNNAAYLAVIRWGPPPSVRSWFDAGNLYYTWARQTIFDNFENIVGVEVIGSGRTSACGRGYAENVGYAGGLSVDNLRLTRTPLCPLPRMMRTVVENCALKGCSDADRLAYTDLESGDPALAAPYARAPFIDPLLDVLAQKFIDAKPGGLTLPRGSGYRPKAYQAHFRDLHDLSQDLADLLDGLAANDPLRAQCRVRLDEVNREIDVKHGLYREGGKPFNAALPIGAQLPIVGPDSNHSIGQAVDIGRRADYVGTLSNISPSVDSIAENIGLNRPIVSDKVHYEIGGALGVLKRRAAALRFKVQSPIDILVTDPRGRRIGYDPATASVINDFPDADESFYRGPGMEPQILMIGDTAPGEYVVSAVGTGTGPYTVTVQEITEHGEIVGERRFAGTASPGSILEIGRHILADPQLDQVPPLVDAPLPITIISAGPITRVSSPQLAAFLNSARALDEMFGDAETLPVLANGIEVSDSTAFPLGTTTVTFRFGDVRGNVGSATSTVTVTSIAKPPPSFTAYAPLRRSNKLARFDTATGQLLGTTDLLSLCGFNAPDPIAVGIDRAGFRAFVLNPVCHVIEVVDLKTNRKLQDVYEVGTEGYPTSIEFDKQGRYAYVGSQRSRSGSTSPGFIEVLNVRRLSVEAKIETHGEPGGLAIHPDGTTLYATLEPNRLEIVDLATRAVTGSIILPGRFPRDVVLSHDGSRAFVITSDFSQAMVAVVDTVTRSLVTSIPVPANPSSLALHPAANRVYVQHQAGITVLSTTTLQVLESIAAPGTGRLVFSPDGAQLLGADALSSLAVRNLADGTVTPVSLGGQPGGPAIAPACTYETSEPVYTQTASGGLLRVNVTAPAGCPWSVGNDAPWLTVLTPSGTGSGEIQLQSTANAGVSRKALLSVSGESFTVVQSGPSPSYGFVPTARELGWRERSYGPALAVVDLDVNESVAYVPGGSPLATAPSGSRIYLSPGTMLDTASLRVLEDPGAAGGSVDMDVSPDGALVASIGDNTIWVSDAATNRPLWTLPVDSATFEDRLARINFVGPGGGQLFATRRNGTIVVIDVAQHTVVTSFLPVAGFHNLVVSGDRRFVFGTANADNETSELLVIDVASRTVLRRFAIPWQPGNLVVNPQATYGYLEYDDDIVRIDLESGSTTRWSYGLMFGSLSLDPSGQRLYAPHIRGLNSIAVIDASTGAMLDSIGLNAGNSPGQLLALQPPTPPVTCQYNFRHFSFVAQEGRTGTIDIVPTLTGCGEWRATSDSSWITFTGSTTGRDYGTLTFAVQPNTGLARTGSIDINGRKFAIRQRGNTVPLVITSVEPSAGLPGGLQWVNIKGSGFESPYVVRFGGQGSRAFYLIDPNTMAVLTPPGAVNTTVDVQVWETNRIATLKNAFSYTASGAPPCTPVVAQPPLVSAAGGPIELDVTAPANCSWPAASAVSWITAADGGTGTARARLTIAANTSTARRTGLVHIAGTAIAITQAALGEGTPPCTPGLSATSAQVNGNGGKTSVAVTAVAGCMWGIAPSAAWISAEGNAVRTGSGAVTLVVAVNSTSSARVGFVEIAGQTFTVRQAASQADIGFGDAGKVTVDFGGATAIAKAVALQPDGKIVVAGQTRASAAATSGDFALARLNADGTLDGTFGAGGKVITDFDGLDDGANAVIVQPDGKIVAAGFANNSTQPNGALVRYLADGRLDPEFGTGGRVRVLYPYDIKAIALQSDGRIVSTGRGWDPAIGMDQTAVSRHLATGEVDATFGGGTVTFDVGQQFGVTGGWHDWGTAVTVLGDGKILVGGTGLVLLNQSNQYDFFLVRLRADGAFDTAFGTNGVAPSDMDNGLGAYDSLNALAVQADGKIVGAGGASMMWNGPQYFPTFSLTRHSAGGVPDSTFGQGAKVQTILDYTAPFSWSAGITGVAIETSGRIAVAGNTAVKFGAPSDFRVARYTTSGGIDGVFAVNGYVTTDFFGLDDFANGMALQQDGRIVVVGQAFMTRDQSVFGIARYEGGGSCTYSAASWFSSYEARGGFGYVDVTAPLGCAWTATSNVPWLSLTSPASGTGTALVTFRVAENATGGVRTGTLTIAGKTITVTQAGGCQYTLSHTGVNVGAASRAEHVTVTAPAGCSWTASGNGSWVSIGSGASGSGNGAVTLLAQANSSPLPRLGTATIAGQTFTIAQAGAPLTSRRHPSFADFDGNGIGDVLLYNSTSGAYSVQLATPGAFTQIASGTWAAGFTAVLPLNLNGDALTDLFLYNKATGAYVKGFNLGNGVFGFSSAAWAAGFDLLVADWNGDGLSDLFLHNPLSGLYFRVTNVGGGAAFDYASGTWAAGFTAYPTDYDADGRTDLFIYNANAGHPYTGLWFQVFNTGAGFAFKVGPSRWGPGFKVFPMDFDGDGRFEIFIYHPAGYWLKVFFTPGDPVYQYGTWGPNFTINTGNFNGDAATDLFLYNPLNGLNFVVTTGAAGAFGYYSNTWGGAFEVQVSDFNSDGISDVFLYNPINGLRFQVHTLAPGVFNYFGGTWAPGLTPFTSAR